MAKDRALRSSLTVLVVPGGDDILNFHDARDPGMMSSTRATLRGKKAHNLRSHGVP